MEELTLCLLLVFAWARFSPAHILNWRLHVSGQCYAPNTDYGLPCNTCTDTLGKECADHAAALGSLGLTRWVRHNFDTSAALELKQRRYLRTRVSAVFLIGFFVTLTHAFVSLVILLSALFPARFFCSSEEAVESPTSCVSTASSSGESFAYNTWNPLLGTAISRTYEQHLDTLC